MPGKLPGLTYHTWDAMVKRPWIFQGHDEGETMGKMKELAIQIADQARDLGNIPHFQKVAIIVERLNVPWVDAEGVTQYPDVAWLREQVEAALRGYSAL